MTDTKALALTLDGFADHLEQGGTRCENKPKDVAVFREAARILRDVVPGMEAVIDRLRHYRKVPPSSPAGYARWEEVTAALDALQEKDDAS